MNIEESKLEVQLGKLETLVETKFEYLGREVKDVKDCLENLKNNFVTRDEHMQVRRIVMGDTGDGGLLAKFNNLSLKMAIAAGAGGVIIWLLTQLANWITNKSH